MQTAWRVKVKSYSWAFMKFMKLIYSRDLTLVRLSENNVLKRLAYIKLIKVSSSINFAKDNTESEIDDN